MTNIFTMLSSKCRNSSILIHGRDPFQIIRYFCSASLRNRIRMNKLDKERVATHTNRLDALKQFVESNDQTNNLVYHPRLGSSRGSQSQHFQFEDRRDLQKNHSRRKQNSKKKLEKSSVNSRQQNLQHSFRNCSISTVLEPYALLCPTKQVVTSKQVRNLSTRATNNLSSDTDHLDRNIMLLDENQNCQTNTEPILASPQTPTIVQLKDLKEINPILKKFPFPKNVLNNFYTILAEELKDKSLKPESFYKSEGKSGLWSCIYHLKWPEPMKVSAKAFTKKEASKAAAAKVLDVLQSKSKMCPEGLPLIYQKAEIKQLHKQKQTVVKLDSIAVRRMNDIINVFNTEMKGVVEQYFEKGIGTSDMLKEGTGSNFRNRQLQFLGDQKYYAKEQIQLPISSFK